MIKSRLWTPERQFHQRNGKRPTKITRSNSSKIVVPTVHFPVSGPDHGDKNSPSLGRTERLPVQDLQLFS